MTVMDIVLLLAVAVLHPHCGDGYSYLRTVCLLDWSTFFPEHCRTAAVVIYSLWSIACVVGLV